jgi:hypothetical protein
MPFLPPERDVTPDIEYPALSHNFQLKFLNIKTESLPLLERQVINITDYNHQLIIEFELSSSLRELSDVMKLEKPNDFLLMNIVKGIDGWNSAFVYENLELLEAPLYGMRFDYASSNPQHIKLKLSYTDRKIVLGETLQEILKSINF